MSERGRATEIARTPCLNSSLQTIRMFFLKSLQLAHGPRVFDPVVLSLRNTYPLHKTIDTARTLITIVLVHAKFSDSVVLQRADAHLLHVFRCGFARRIVAIKRY